MGISNEIDTPIGTPSCQYGDDNDGQKNAIELRRCVHRLFFQEGLSKTMIAKREHLSKAFVVRWTQSLDQDLSRDERGWIKGTPRQWDEKLQRRVARLHAALKNNPHEFFSGATAVQQRYAQRYASEALPSLRTIGRLLKALGLSEPRRRGRSTGAAAYLCYPEHTIYESLGSRLLEVDFIGKKFITGRSEPLNFIGFSFKKEPRLRYFKRVEAQTTEVILGECAEFFEHFEKPALLKVDNCAATIGTQAGKRTISKFIYTMLQHEVVPIFAVPRKPFSQASIEGNNSVFARKFWNCRSFSTLKQIDRQLQWFNTASASYCGYQRVLPAADAATAAPKVFVPRVYFLRQVKEQSDGTAVIDVLNEKITLPSEYIQYFVLAEWNLHTQKLIVWFEKQRKAKRIKTLTFTVNPNSRYSIP